MENFLHKLGVIFLIGSAVGVSFPVQAQSKDYTVPQFLQCHINPLFHKLECKLPSELTPWLQFIWGGGNPGTYTFEKGRMPLKNGFVIYDYRSTVGNVYEYQTTYAGITADLSSPNWKVQPNGSAVCYAADGNCPFTNVPYGKK